MTGHGKLEKEVGRDGRYLCVVLLPLPSLVYTCTHARAPVRWLATHGSSLLLRAVTHAARALRSSHFWWRHYALQLPCPRFILSSVTILSLEFLQLRLYMLFYLPFPSYYYIPRPLLPCPSFILRRFILRLLYFCLAAFGLFCVCV